MNDIISNLYESWFSKGYPQDWKISRIKDLISLIRKEKNKSEETPVISLTINGVKLKNNLSEGMNPETYIGHQLVYPGDLVICLRDLDGPLLVGISEHYGCTSNLYVILQIANQNIEYYNHVFKTMDFLRVIDDFSYGMRHSYNISQFGQLRLPVPQRYIQDRIVKELNTLEVKINQLINNQQQQIEKLKEYKQSLISEVVTKGLNSNVEFIDSGNEWLEKIPSTWNVTKLLNILEQKVTDGPHESLTLHDEGIPFISAEAIKNDKIDFNLRRGNISKDDYEICCKKYIPKINDIYMVKSGATTGNLAIVETDEIFTIWSPLAVIRAKSSYNYKYLFYFLKSDNFQKQVQLNWSYGTQQNLSMRVLEKLSIAIPPYKEQVDMVELLDNKTSKIDKLIVIKNKKLRELNDYKKSLIYEYVTGKKELS